MLVTFNFRNFGTILFCALFAAISAPSLVVAGDQAGALERTTGVPIASDSEVAFVELHETLTEVLRDRDFKIYGLEFEDSISADGDFGTLSTSCTATATVGIPGGTEVGFEATAPTCVEAAQMIQDAIEEFLDNLPV